METKSQCEFGGVYHFQTIAVKELGTCESPCLWLPTMSNSMMISVRGMLRVIGTVDSSLVVLSRVLGTRKKC